MLSPYSESRDTELILRDRLAIDRTALANERTLLAYLRTGITLLLAGMTFVHFSDRIWFSLVGLLCIPAGIVAFYAGFRNFRAMKQKIVSSRHELEQDC